MTTTPKLGMTLMTANQSQKEVTFNEAMARLDCFAQLSVIDRDLNTPPASPATGDTYIIGPSPTGAWASNAGKIALYNAGWLILAPVEGWKTWIQDEDVLAVYTGSAWTTNLPLGMIAAGTNEFRLTLTSGTPVTTADVTSSSTIYCCPYKGSTISLYVGSRWVMHQSAQFSLALSGLTASRPYDVFCYSNAGVPTLEFLAWSSDTARATSLTFQDGVLVKSGDATRRYLGTFYTTGTTTTADSAANRYLWNYYNKVVRPMYRNETTASWTYTTATARQANAATANQLNFVIGVSEDAVRATLQAMASNTTAGVTAYIGIGLDSTSTIATGSIRGGGRLLVAATLQPMTAFYDGLIAAGRHYLSWLEYSAATGTTTWSGTTDGNQASGMIGSLLG